MYKPPSNFKRFDIDRYFAEVSNISHLIHPDWPFLKGDGEVKQIAKLFTGIEKSLSLDKTEKLKILFYELGHFRKSALIDVFEDEEVEFRKIIKTEANYVFDLAVTAHHTWKYQLLPELLSGPRFLDKSEKFLLLDAMMPVKSDSGDDELENSDGNIFQNALLDYEESTPDIDDFLKTPELDDDFDEYELLYDILTNPCDADDEDKPALLETLLAAVPDCDGGPP